MRMSSKFATLPVYIPHKLHKVSLEKFNKQYKNIRVLENTAFIRRS